MNESGRQSGPRAETAAAPYAIIVSFDLKEACRDAFLGRVLANAAASLEGEADCLRFDVLVPASHDGPDIVLYEVYSDRSGFDAHLASPHFAEFDVATREMVARKTIVEYRLENAQRQSQDRSPARLNTI